MPEITHWAIMRLRHWVNLKAGAFDVAGFQHSVGFIAIYDNQDVALEDAEDGDMIVPLRIRGDENDG
jgi:hypothetical protein